MKKILVPTDFSVLATSAARYAIDMAREMKSEIILAYVVEIEHGNSRVINWKKLQEHMIDDAKIRFEALTRELSGYSAGINISTTILLGAPIEKRITDFAQENNIDIIVAGTKGATGLRAVILGSNTAALINNSDIPVIAVPEELKYNGFRRIVLATDMVDLDRHAREVVKFGKSFNAQIDILHITNVQTPASAHNELKAMIKHFTGYNNIELHVVPGDDVVASLNSYVIESNADLLVMFTHELSLFEKLFGRGRTRKVAFHSEVPLLAFKRDV